jgi:hypothetical protein
MDVAGAAQNPVHDYQIVRKHPVGHKKARTIAIDNGVNVEPSVNIKSPFLQAGRAH